MNGSLRQRGLLWGALALLASSCGPENPAHPGIISTGSEDQALTVCAAGATVQGIDVSSYQGAVNWSAVASSGRKFAFAKATEGTWYQDPTFPGNWRGMKAAGIYRGAYHFFRASVSGLAQADYYLAYVGPFGPGDLPMLDWEVTDGVSNQQNITEAQAFVDEIKAKTGLPTVIYSGYYFYNGLGNPSQFAPDPFFIADYTSGCPLVPSPWTTWTFWQYSSTGSVPGVSGNCDVDEFNGSLSQLGQLFNGSSAPLVAQVTGNDAMTFVNWPDKHVEGFVKTPAGAEDHVWTTGTNDSWLGPSQLDTGAECGSAAAFWGDPWLYPELFSPLSSNSTGHLWWANSAWNSYQGFGGSNLSHLATLVWLDGHTEVFALDSSGATYHQFWDVGSSSWSGWQSLGGVLTSGVGPIMWENGTAEIFGTSPNHGVYHMWSGSGAGFTGGWSSWQPLGTGSMASRPIPVRWPDGHVEVFATGADGQLYHDWFDMQTGWQAAFQQLSPGFQIIGEPSVIMNPGGAEVFARDAQGYVVHLWYTSAGWTNFTRLGAQRSQSDPFAWIRGDGQAEVFAIDPSGALVRNLRSGSTWGSWSSIGTGLDPCAPALPPTTTGGSTGGTATSGGSTGGKTTTGGGTTTGSSTSGGSSTGGATSSGGTTGASATAGGSSSGSASGGSTGISLGGTTGAVEDGGTPTADGGNPNVISGRGGCGCSSDPSGALSILGLVGLWVLRRRRLLA
ncbi:MAG: GH25 family lysozyme [Deltaproteobacteria bacterium]